VFHTDYTMPPVEEEDPVIPVITADEVSAISVERFLVAAATGDRAVPPAYVVALAGALAGALIQRCVLCDSSAGEEESGDNRFDSEIVMADFLWQAQRIARVSCGVSENADTIESILKETEASATAALDLAKRVGTTANGDGIFATDAAKALLKTLEQFLETYKY